MSIRGGNLFAQFQSGIQLESFSIRRVAIFKLRDDYGGGSAWLNRNIPEAIMEVYFGNLTAERGQADKLAGEIESLVQNAEELVQSTGSQLPEQERQRLGELLARLKSSAAEFKLQAVIGLKATDRVIRKHPYQSAGIALVVGLLVGVLVARPGRDDA